MASRVVYNYSWWKSWCSITLGEIEIPVAGESFLSQVKGKRFHFDGLNGSEVSVALVGNLSDYVIQSESCKADFFSSGPRGGVNERSSGIYDLGVLYIDGFELEVVTNRSNTLTRLVTEDKSRIACWNMKFGCGKIFMELVIRESIPDDVASIILAMPLVMYDIQESACS